MAFLLAGLAIGATAVALSESDRNRYYDRRGSLSFLGVRQGSEVYLDRVTGVYYLESGYDIKTIGKPGWHAHPVDRMRLRSKLEKHAPGEIKWLDFLLACYAGRERELWNTLFKRYELPREPKKPHKFITEALTYRFRRERFEKYEKEVELWEEQKSKAIEKFREEHKSWEKKKAEFSTSDTIDEIKIQGKNLVSRALSGNTIFLEVTPKTNLYRIKVPAGASEGQLLSVSVEGKTVQVAVPPGASPGQEIQFSVPKAPVNSTNTSHQAPSSVDASVKSTTSATASDTAPLPPPAIGSNEAQSQKSKVPAAIGSGVPKSNGNRRPAPPPAIGSTSVSGQPPLAIGATTDVPPAIGS